MGPIDLATGQSQVIVAPWPATHVAVADPKIADVQVLNPQQVLILGKAPGTTDLLLLGEGQHSWHSLVRVKSDVETLRTQIKKLFPDMDAQFSQAGETVAVSGTLRNADEAQQLHSFLTGTGRKYVDLTRVAGPQQVLVRVRVAEADRTAIRSLGINFLQGGGSFFSGSTVNGNANNINIGPPEGANITQQIPFQFNSATSVSPAITMLTGIPAADLQFFIEALSDNQYMRILAEPNLVALSGEEASFLVGGEYPIPVVQGGTAGTASSVTIDYKEYGVRLKFKPTVLGDGTIRLHVVPEVSQLSDVGAVVISGFSIPALITRRADTTLQIKSGQTFAMAGLIDHTVIARAQHVPGLGSIPVLGALFRSVRYETDDTEMVVLTTVTLAEPLSITSARPLPGELHQAPSDWELYAEGRIEGRQPHLAPPQTQWVREHGLTQLKGPGGWTAYDDPEPDRSQVPTSATGSGTTVASPNQP